MHIPVLHQEVLDVCKDHVILSAFDGTLGAGGHALLLLENHPECKRYVGIDQDPNALLLAKEKLSQFSSKVFLSQGVFQEPPDELFDLILIDIGVSSMQLDDEKRGFSFMHDGPLDMRMNPDSSTSAEDVVNSWDKTSLADLFYNYGEERMSRRAAQAIFDARKKKRITTTLELASILEKALPRFGKAHPATKVFQAIRIEVNQELLALEQGLSRLANRLNPGGLFLVITFHSLEDRMVKQAFRELAKAHDFTIITKKPIAPSFEEIKQNRRSRSAHLRVIMRK